MAQRRVFRVAVPRVPSGMVAHIAVVPLAAVALAACSVGVEAGTLNEAPITGARADAGLVKIRNAIVIAPAEDGGEATLSVTIVNDGTTGDSLLGVELSGSDGAVPVSLRPGTIDLPPESATIIPTGTRPTAVVDAADVGNLAAGTYTTATFSFADAGSVALEVLVVAPVGWWADVGGPSVDATG